jgi:hypothetical protein
VPPSAIHRLRVFENTAFQPVTASGTTNSVKLSG